MICEVFNFFGFYTPKAPTSNPLNPVGFNQTQSIHSCIMNAFLIQESTVPVFVDRASIPLLTGELLLRKHWWGYPWKRSGKYIFTMLPLLLHFTQSS